MADELSFFQGEDKCESSAKYTESFESYILTDCIKDSGLFDESDVFTMAVIATGQPQRNTAGVRSDLSQWVKYLKRLPAASEKDIVAMCHGRLDDLFSDGVSESLVNCGGEQHVQPSAMKSLISILKRYKPFNEVEIVKIALKCLHMAHHNQHLETGLDLAKFLVLYSDQTISDQSASQIKDALCAIAFSGEENPQYLVQFQFPTL